MLHIIKSEIALIRNLKFSPFLVISNQIVILTHNCTWQDYFAIYIQMFLVDHFLLFCYYTTAGNWNRLLE